MFEHINNKLSDWLQFMNVYRCVLQSSVMLVFLFSTSVFVSSRRRHGNIKPKHQTKTQLKTSTACVCVCGYVTGSNSLSQPTTSTERVKESENKRPIRGLRVHTCSADVTDVAVMLWDGWSRWERFLRHLTTELEV